jgi:hypothetical protein
MQAPTLAKWGESILEPEKYEGETRIFSPFTPESNKPSKENFFARVSRGSSSGIHGRGAGGEYGFSPHSDPGSFVDPNTPLRLADNYYFWLEVGLPVMAASKKSPVPCPRSYCPSRPGLRWSFPSRSQLTPAPRRNSTLDRGESRGRPATHPLPVPCPIRP